MLKIELKDINNNSKDPVTFAILRDVSGATESDLRKIEPRDYTEAVVFVKLSDFDDTGFPRLFYTITPDKKTVIVIGWLYKTSLTLRVRPDVYTVHSMEFIEEKYEDHMDLVMESETPPHLHTLLDASDIVSFLKTAEKEMTPKDRHHILGERIKILRKANGNVLAPQDSGNQSKKPLSGILCCEDNASQIFMLALVLSIRKNEVLKSWIDSEIDLLVTKTRALTCSEREEFVDAWIKTNNASTIIKLPITDNVPKSETHSGFKNIYVLDAISNILILAKRECVIDKGKLYATADDLIYTLVCEEFSNRATQIHKTCLQTEELTQLTKVFIPLAKFIQPKERPKRITAPIQSKLVDIEDLLDYLPPCQWQNYKDLTEKKVWKHDQRLGANFYIDLGYTYDECLSFTNKNLSENKSDSDPTITSRKKEVESVLKLGMKSEKELKPASRSCMRMIEDSKNKHRSCPFSFDTSEALGTLLKGMANERFQVSDIISSKAAPSEKCRAFMAKRLGVNQKQVPYFSTPYNFTKICIEQSKKKTE